MNQLKQFILSAATVLMVLPLNAQTNDSKYIEVTVTDSTEINPDIIEYSFTLIAETTPETTYTGSDDDYNQPPVTNYAEVQKKKQEENMLKLKMLEKRFNEILSKDKLFYTRNEENNYTKYMYGEYDYGYGYGEAKNKAYVVKFVSFSMLDKFLSKIPEDIKYNGRISSISSTKIRDAEMALLEKTLLKAKKQAEMISTISGINLGTVIQFSDSGPSTTSGANYEQLIAQLGSIYQGQAGKENERKITLTKTIRVRYSIQ